MPLYEYRCSVCGAKEEKIQSFSAPAEHDCAQCGQAAGMTRQLSRTAFTLAGGGWYASGYGEGKGGTTATTSLPAPEASREAAKEATPSSGGCASGCACHSPSIQAKVDALDKA
ncbi:MAG: zinc ribbon domain-containing protein [Acidobacteria bacterium]|nr:zinc ribbon domain-containing protein [Acidobacteriota bacterium]